MKDFVLKSGRPTGVLLDLYAGIRFTVKTCVLLHQHRKLVWCSENSELLAAANVHLLLAIVSRMLVQKSNISGKGEREVAIEVSKDQKAALPASKTTSLWKVWPELDAKRVLSGKIVHFISAFFDKYFVYEMCCHLLLKLW